MKTSFAVTAALVVALQLWQAPRLTTQANPPQPTLGELFAKPPDDSRIMMRWWWFGPSITESEIARDLRKMKEGGIGGFEVAVVYPLAVDDPARGVRNYEHLSPEFLNRLGFAARTARELGLRMDVTLGSGWSFGGPHIPAELAASRLRSDRREIAPSVTQVARPLPNDHEQLIAGFVGNGAVREVDTATFRELDLSGNGPIAIPHGSGPRTLVFYFASRTGQVVKRAAIGAEGYVLDHYSREAIERHLREVGDRLIAAAGPGGIHAIFCDSLEVYEADWTPDMLTEFRKRRGYDLRPELPLIDFGGDARTEQLRRDVGRTLTELYEERFLRPIQDWSRRNKVLFRMQGYGTPPAAIASHRYVDLIDGEGFEWRMLSRARWASSAAHLFGRAVTASETWTWIHSPAFRATPLDVKAEADLHFLSGINQLIGHGWPHTAEGAPAPGWPFYAAGAFTDRNPWWPVMPDLAAYLQRVSFLLRQGEPVTDVALYAPTDDARAAMRPGTGEYLNLWATVRERVGPSVVPAILDAGYSFDLIDDGTLKEAASRKYKAIVVPRTRLIPAETSAWLKDYARGGGVVVRESDVAGQLTARVQPDVRSFPTTPEIGFVHRRAAGADIYFVVNTSNVSRTVSLRFRAWTRAAELWDPMNGKTHGLDPDAEGGVLLSFEPYGSRIVVFRSAPSDPDARGGVRRTVMSSQELQTGWSVTIGERTVAVQLPHSWHSDAATRHFSGTAVYRIHLEKPAGARDPEARVVLDFGDAKAIAPEPLADGTMRGNSFAALVAPPIRESAIVRVNGRRAGAVWAPPYRVDLTEHLIDGKNEVTVDVYNTAINQLAEGGRLPDVRAVAERYGQRFRLQDMDVLEPVPSGILSIPRLVVER